MGPGVRGPYIWGVTVGETRVSAYVALITDECQARLVTEQDSRLGSLLSLVT